MTNEMVQSRHRPAAPPEAQLLEQARKALVPTRSQNDAGAGAGISGARWRQVVAGYRRAGKGAWIPETPPADTLARMARSVGVTADQMEVAGRADVAALIRRNSVEDALAHAANSRPPTFDLARRSLAAAKTSIDEAMAVLADLEGKR